MTEFYIITILILPQRKHKTKNTIMNIDVIFLSDEKTSDLTQVAIDTIKLSEENINFKIIVIEDSKHKYAGVKNIKLTQEFNYNKHMNIGASMGTSEYIVFCNNDLVFSKGWFSEMLKYKKDCMSPKCPVDFRQMDKLEPIVSSYEIGNVFSGWCFVLKRTIWEEIGGLDEDFKFWFADNATVEQLKNIGVMPNLITNSLVTHLGSRTLKMLDVESQSKLTIEQSALFASKYKSKPIINTPPREIFRYDIINDVIKRYEFDTYLEIGFQNGICFGEIACVNKAAVDPYPLQTVPQLRITTSDLFFESNTDNYDVVFIDGLHTYQQVKADFENAIKIAKVIILHDMNPSTEERARSFDLGGQWNGDCYKLGVDLANGEYNLRYITIDEDQGTMVVFNQYYKQTVVEEYSHNYNFFDQNRNSILNLRTYSEFTRELKHIF